MRIKKADQKKYYVSGDQVLECKYEYQYPNTIVKLRRPGERNFRPALGLKCLYEDNFYNSKSKALKRVKLEAQIKELRNQDNKYFNLHLK